MRRYRPSRLSRKQKITFGTRKRWKLIGKSRSLPGSCKPKWSGWPDTQNNRKSCGNCLRLLGTIPLLSLSAWPGWCQPNALVAELSVNDKDQRFALLRTQAIGSKFNITTLGKATYALPEIYNPDVCTDNTWTPTSLISAPLADLVTRQSGPAVKSSSGADLTPAF